MFITTVSEKRGHELEGIRKSILEGFEGGKKGRNDTIYIILL